MRTVRGFGWRYDEGLKKQFDLNGLSPSWYSFQDSSELPGEVVELVDQDWKELSKSSTKRPYCRPVRPLELSGCFLNWMKELKEDSWGEALGDDFEEGKRFRKGILEEMRMAKVKRIFYKKKSLDSTSNTKKVHRLGIEFSFQLVRLDEFFDQVFFKRLAS